MHKEPAENVYYEIMVKTDTMPEEKGIVDYSMDKKVIPVSPNTFYVYLQTILFGLKGLEIEGSAQEITATLARLRGDFSRFQKDFRLIGTHLHNTSRCYDSADRRFELFKDKLEQLETPPKAGALRSRDLRVEGSPQGQRPKAGMESASSQPEVETAPPKKEAEL